MISSHQTNCSIYLIREMSIAKLRPCVDIRDLMSKWIDGTMNKDDLSVITGFKDGQTFMNLPDISWNRKARLMSEPTKTHL